MRMIENNEEMVTVKLAVPSMSDFDINCSIDNLISCDDYMKEINRLVIKDEKERYIRELLNRLNKITKYMENFVGDTETGGIHPEVVISVAKGYPLFPWEKYLDEKTYKMLTSEVKNEERHD